MVIIPLVVLGSSFPGPCRLGSELGYLRIDNRGVDLRFLVRATPGRRHFRSADASRRGDLDSRRPLSRETQESPSTSDLTAIGSRSLSMSRRQRAAGLCGEPSPPLGQPEAADSSPRGAPLAPRSARRSADRPPLEAASDPRLCPESRRVPQSPSDGTAAAQAACTSRWNGQHRGRPLTPNVVTSSVNSTNSAPFSTCRARSPCAPCPPHSRARSPVRVTACPKPKAS